MMRYFDLINCCLTTFGPFFVVYKASCLGSSAGILLLLGCSTLIYLTCQLCKSLVLVILSEVIGYVWVFHQLLNLLELPGLHIFLQLRLAGRLDVPTRVLSAGFGWGLADVLAQNLIPLLMELIGGVEYSPRFFYRALLANIVMLSRITFGALVYMWGRRKQWSGTSRRVLAVLSLLHASVLPAAFGEIWSLGSQLEEVGGAARGAWALSSATVVVVVAAVATRWLFIQGQLPGGRFRACSQSQVLATSQSQADGKVSTGATTPTPQQRTAE
eukprot:GHVS01064403.1.p1 GENE.GHVS01064403.1~~GHVS01064403.1.p1  ORF type:complete len:272 (+),score=35.64 GHVS01064403.1:86-901(+)